VGVKGLPVPVAIGLVIVLCAAPSRAEWSDPIGPLLLPGVNLGSAVGPDPATFLGGDISVAKGTKGFAWFGGYADVVWLPEHRCSFFQRLTHTAVCNTIVCMHVDRLSITLDPRLGLAARRAAKRARMSLSAWIAEATADRVRNEELGRALDQWEAEDGTFTSKELTAAAQALGLVRKPKGRGR
jgi:hypothetical protein